jgi:hypothetical protein
MRHGGEKAVFSEAGVLQFDVFLMQEQNLENLRRNGVTPISMASTYSYKKPGHHRPGATSCALSIAIFLIMPCPPWIPL